MTVTHDEVFQTNTVFGVTWLIGRSPRGRVSTPTIFDRLREPVQRNYYVARKREALRGVVPLTDTDGEEITVVHVDSSATGANLGTFEDPYTSLDVVHANSAQEGDIVFVHADSTFDGQSISLKDRQRFLGEGAPGGHFVTTKQLGEIQLPESSPGASSGNVPAILNAPGAAVQLANNNEVSGFTIDGGAQGIASLNGSGSAVIDRVTIQNTTSHGVHIQNGTGNFSFTDTTITNTGGTAFNLQGGTANVSYTGKITQGNDAAAVSVSGGHTGTVTFSEAVAGEGVVTATNGSGLQFNDADGTYRFNHAVTLNGGDAGIDILNDSGGSFTFSNATITDPTGTAFNLAGGTATVSFTGKITQSNDAAAVSVSGGHKTGTVSFSEAVSGDGVVEASNGSGLQFDDADGTYRFNQAVTLNGGDAGIDILNDSGGSFTFNNATITDPTATAFNLAGGTATVSFTGKITQSNDVAAVSVSGGHKTGTVTFSEAASGPGFWRHVLGGLYAVYGATGALWIVLFVCPYCHLYGTGLCSCGYDRAASRLRQKKDGDRFAQQFRRHLPVIVPLWFLPLVAGIIGLISQFSWALLGLLLAFAVNSYLILPLVSRQHGSASCLRKSTCP